ncbi:hypothetical protein [Roseateles paludis]|uniref:DUF2987 domain-containing protein n=1 Tax=Roseateles paludis TaxID=3145238 RepID=A0ABV0G0J8_9BURK
MTKRRLPAPQQQLLHLTLAGIALLSSGARAQDAPDTPAVLPTVETQLKRDQSVMPYGRINELMRKLAQYGEGLVRMDWKVDAEKSKVPIAQMRMAIASDEGYHPIQIAPDGSFKLPLLPAEQAKSAEVATNTAKGQMTVRGSLELNLTPEQLDMATVRRLMRLSHRLKTELLPWYLRWLFPDVQGVLVCAPQAPFELEWHEGERPEGQLMAVQLPANDRAQQAKDGEPARVCLLLTGQERWGDSARLVPTPGTKLNLKLGS